MTQGAKWLLAVPPTIVRIPPGPPHPHLDSHLQSQSRNFHLAAARAKPNNSNKSRNFAAIQESSRRASGGGIKAGRDGGNLGTTLLSGPS